MPSREEIVEWLLEAEAILKDYESLLENIGRRMASHDIQCLHEEFAERAAQVSDMRCETCAKKVTAKPFIHNSSSYLVEHCPWQDCGGCFQYEQKPAG